MSDVVRWGVLGTARFAQSRWIPALLKTPGAIPAAIASRDADRAREAAGRFGFARACGSYEDLLADPGIDAVYIPLPNGLHCRWAVQAAEAGKHVLVEKPAAASLAEAREMASAAGRAGVRLMEAFMPRHHERWRRLRQLVDEGVIGIPRLIQGDFCFTLDDPHNARWDPEQAGGALADVGCYVVNGARYILGQEPVWAFGQARDTDERGVDSTFNGSLEFEWGSMNFLCSFETGFHQSFTVLGTEGSLELNAPWTARQPPLFLHIHSRSGESCDEEFPEGDQYVEMIRHFQGCIRDPDKPLWPAEDGLAQAAALDALRRSAMSNRLEAVESVAENAL